MPTKTLLAMLCGFLFATVGCMAPQDSNPGTAGVSGTAERTPAPAPTPTPPLAKPPEKTVDVSPAPTPAPAPAKSPEVKPDAPRKVESVRLPPKATEMKAGWADDNAQYNYYLRYLDRFANTKALKLDICGRITFTVLDSQGRSLPNCRLTVTSRDGKVLCERRTYADGRAMFFPWENGNKSPTHLKVEARWEQSEATKEFDLEGPQAVELRLPVERPALQQVPLDVAFVIDTTSSMGDEIEKLKSVLAAVHVGITQMSPAPLVRFGMVVYRDHGDAYVTRLTPFTSDIDAFAKALAEVKAEGGGDDPEDVQEALRVTAEDLKWRPQAVKLAFLLGDAPPHLDYGEQFTYVKFMRFAAGNGLKMTTIGASGLDNKGEYVWRQLAQYTMGQFIFLTYGEKGESKAETPWTVSHHTGNQWETRNLDTIIVQSVARELSNLTDRPVQAPEDYFEARPAGGVAGTKVLAELFAECARQIVDFSQVRLEEGTPTAVAPVLAGEGCPAGAADAMGDQLTVALSRHRTFKLLERDGLKQVLDELDLNKSLAFDAKLTPRPEKQLPAKMLVLSRLRRDSNGFSLFVKMVRTETGEVVSATMLKIDGRLLETPGENK